MFTRKTLTVGGSGIFVGFAPLVALPSDFVGIPTAILGLTIGTVIFILYLDSITRESIPKEEINDRLPDESGALSSGNNHN